MAYLVLYEEKGWLADFIPGTDWLPSLQGKIFFLEPAAHRASLVPRGQDTKLPTICKHCGDLPRICLAPSAPQRLSPPATFPFAPRIQATC
jgi:hypothetical protein